MENVAIVQPTLHLKNKELNIKKNIQKPAQSPTHATSSESNTHLSQKKVREVPPYRDPPGPASPPLRTLPPYRDPPPPNLNSPGRSHFQSSTNIGSPHVHKEDQPSSSNSVKLKRNLIQVLQINIFFKYKICTHMRVHIHTHKIFLIFFIYYFLYYFDKEKMNEREN